MDHYLNLTGWGLAVLQSFLYIALAPLLVGWVRKVKARLQNRRGAPLLQAYRDLYKLLVKEAQVAHTASPLFRAAPYLAKLCQEPFQVFGGGFFLNWVIRVNISKDGPSSPRISKQRRNPTVASSHF